MNRSMKSKLSQVLCSFIEAYCQKQKPVLLGLSGGSDSLGLFHSLMECSNQIELHVVHFDHGWREESSQQAVELGLYVKNRNVAFHLEKGIPIKKTEEEAREQRYAFFQKIYSLTQAQGLFLAHHKEDLAQTVLKRLLEGSNLFALKTMTEISTLKGMEIFRPWLQFSKAEIASEWSFYDSTNDDPRYLRCRMKETMFPELEAVFGKNVVDSLCFVSKQISFFSSYLEKQFLHLLDKNLIQAPFWEVLELSLMHPFEIQEVSRIFLKKHQICLSREAFASMVKFAEIGAVNKQIAPSLFVDQGKLIYSHAPRFPGCYESSAQYVFSNDAEWQFYSSDQQFPQQNPLFGSISYKGRQGKFYGYHELTPKQKKKASQYFAHLGIPVCLRSSFPFFVESDQLISDNAEIILSFFCVILIKNIEIKDKISSFCYSVDTRGGELKDSRYLESVVQSFKT